MSKRRDKSNARAQKVCRELRHQLATHQEWNGRVLVDMVLKWMRVTGADKYERPKR